MVTTAEKEYTRKKILKAQIECIMNMYSKEAVSDDMLSIQVLLPVIRNGECVPIQYSKACRANFKDDPRLILDKHDELRYAFYDMICNGPDSEAGDAFYLDYGMLNQHQRKPSDTKIGYINKKYLIPNKKIEPEGL